MDKGFLGDEECATWWSNPHLVLQCLSNLVVLRDAHAIVLLWGRYAPWVSFFFSLLYRLFICIALCVQVLFFSTESSLFHVLWSNFHAHCVFWSCLAVHIGQLVCCAPFSEAGASQIQEIFYARTALLWINNLFIYAEAVQGYMSIFHACLQHPHKKSNIKDIRISMQPTQNFCQVLGNVIRIACVIYIGPMLDYSSRTACSPFDKHEAHAYVAICAAGQNNFSNLGTSSQWTCFAQSSPRWTAVCGKTLGWHKLVL